MMRILHKNSMECPLPVPNVHGAEKSLEKLGEGTVQSLLTAYCDVFIIGSRALSFSGPLLSLSVEFCWFASAQL